MRASRLFFPFIAALFSVNIAHAVETHAKLWLTTVFTGALSADKKVQFYVEPNVRFIDGKYKFQQTRMWLGLGYELVPRLVLYAGDAPVVTRNADGTYTHENIVWQQANWTAFYSPKLRVISRSRLEERKNLDEAPWAIEFRERLQFKFPLHWESYALILSDELFFNLKSPEWRSTTSFISQNRAYLGIDKQLTQITTFSVGYINQYQFTSPNQMSNILQLALEFNFE